MTITCDTELGEILDSDAITSRLIAHQDIIIKEITKRENGLTAAKENLSSIEVEGEKPFYTFCESLQSSQSDLKGEVTGITSNAINMAIDQELLELIELIARLDEKMKTLDQDYANKIEKLEEMVPERDENGLPKADFAVYQDSVTFNRAEWTRYNDKYLDAIDRRRKLFSDNNLTAEDLLNRHNNNNLSLDDFLSGTREEGDLHLV